MYYVYVIYSSDSDKFYIGQTNNIARRLFEHNDPLEKGWTAKYNSWVLIYQKEFNTRHEAIKFEKYLKSFKNKNTLRKHIAGWSSSSSPGS